MKIFFAFLLSLGFMAAGWSQTSDKLRLHNGKALDVKIVRVNEFNVNYKYVGEDAEQTIGKYAVDKIVYGSGRTEQVSDKVVIASKEDWEKVIIVEDVAAVAGLRKQGEIEGKTSGVFGYHTAASADKKAMKKIKEAAAELGAPFILLTGEKDARSSQGVGLGSAQGIKKGLVYAY